MRAAVLLFALSAGLALLVANQLYGTPGAMAPETSPSPGPGTAGGAALSKIVYADKRAYARINDDNLFSPARRPTMDEDRPGPTPRPQPLAGQPGFELKGIVTTPKGTYALLKLRGESGYRKVVKGETIEGWVLEAIDSDSVLVKKQGTSTVVKLVTPKSSGHRAAPRSRSPKSRPRRQR
jgi:type II secretory pathway component PulC